MHFFAGKKDSSTHPLIVFLLSGPMLYLVFKVTYPLLLNRPFNYMAQFFCCCVSRHFLGHNKPSLVLQMYSKKSNNVYAFLRFRSPFESSEIAIYFYGRYGSSSWMKTSAQWKVPRLLADEIWYITFYRMMY